MQELSKFKNFHEFIEEKAARLKNKTFLISADTDEHVSYEEMNKRANKVANLLKSLGVKKGDRVATLMFDSLEYEYLMFGSLNLGAIFNALNPSLAEEEIEYILGNSEPVFVFVNEDNYKKLKKIKTSIKKENIFSAHFESSEIKSFEEEYKKQDDKFVDEYNVTQDDGAYLIYSSGTTGNPKGILLTQKNTLVEAHAVARGYDLKPEFVSFNCMALFFSGGIFVSFMSTLASEGTSVLQKKFSKTKFWERVEKYKVTWANMVPTIVAFLLNPSEDISKRDVSSFKFVVCGAAPLPVDTMLKFEKIFGVPILEAYGLSENSALTCGTYRSEERKVGSIGKPWDTAEMKIFDNDGKELPPNTEGEIVIKGPHIMKEYWRNPKATAETLKNGWLHSGDLGYVDEDGYFFISGRKKELIIKGGENISPRNIDDIIVKHPSVAEVAAVGVPDEYYGEEIKVFIVLKQGKKATEDEIKEFCLKHLAKFKCPRYVQFIDSMPKTGSGKIQRRKLAEMYKN